jgi:hypothetical protein
LAFQFGGDHQVTAVICVLLIFANARFAVVAIVVCDGLMA